MRNLHQSLKHSSSEQVVAEATARAPQVLVVGAKETLQAELAVEAVAVGLQCAIATDYPKAIAIAKAITSATDQSLAGALLWVEAETFDPAITLLHEIGQRPGEAPVLVITSVQDFAQRLQLVQQGAAVILDAATSPAHAIEAFAQTLKAVSKSAKVVAVDDDPQVLSLLKTLLSPWGFETTTLERPDQLLNTQASVQPDLLLMDVEMPEANGLEICRVLRADEKWQQLPILFLSVHDEDQTQHQAFNVGADDFISKSTMTTELPTRLINRLKRMGKAVPTLT